MGFRNKGTTTQNPVGILPCLKFVFKTSELQRLILYRPCFIVRHKVVLDRVTVLSIYLLFCFSYMCAHTFGRRMVYPGATALINTLVGR